MLREYPLNVPINIRFLLVLVFWKRVLSFIFPCVHMFVWIQSTVVLQVDWNLLFIP